MVADGQVAPVGQQRLGVGAEDAPDVGGVLDRGVEVDVVADRDRQPRPRPRSAGRARRRPPRAPARLRAAARSRRARVALHAGRPSARNGFSTGPANTPGGRSPSRPASASGCEDQRVVADPHGGPRRARRARATTPNGRFSSPKPDPSAPSTQLRHAASLCGAVARRCGRWPRCAARARASARRRPAARRRCRVSGPSRPVTRHRRRASRTAAACCGCWPAARP